MFFSTLTTALLTFATVVNSDGVAAPPPSGAIGGCTAGQPCKCYNGITVDKQDTTTQLATQKPGHMIDCKAIHITASEMKTMDINMFKGSPGLTELQIHNNDELQKIPTGLFDSLPELQVVKITNNAKLSEIDATVFSKNTKLKRVLFQENPLFATGVNNITFINNRNLEDLYLNDNALAFPDPILINSVEEINATDPNNGTIIVDYPYDNPFVTNTFKELVNLKKLYLSGNKIHELNDNTFKYNVNLQYLYLENQKGTNKLDIQKDLFRSLKKLEYLDISSNSIARDQLKSNTLVEQKSLKTLYIQNNYIDSFGNLLRNIPKTCRIVYDADITDLDPAFVNAEPQARP